MKRILGTAVLLLAGSMAVGAAAEPMTFEQAANVTGLAGIQVGADYQYAYEKIAAGGSTAENEVTSTVSSIPIFVRVGLPIMEIKLSAPYGSVKNDVSAAQSNNYAGIQNVGLGLKTGLLALPVFNFAVGLTTKFPTAEPEKYFYGEGLDLNPFLAADVNAMILKLHANVGYEYRGEYNKTWNPLNESTSHSVKLKPGDAIHYNAGVELPLGDTFVLMCEFNGVKYGEVKIDSESLPDSSGMTMNIIPGIAVEKSIFHAHVGVAIPLEKESDRPSYAPRSDWQVLAGASLVFGL